ncbi:hypothetical protein NTG1052_740026 [Candidatus Nitrotoga sp. 1052]|nr:hypothetical protein NTG1052_740026 [Candidatus Nitrotoga sp. 1052]
MQQFLHIALLEKLDMLKLPTKKFDAISDSRLAYTYLARKLISLSNLHFCAEEWF